MTLGKVVGTLVATRKEPTMDGLKFMMVKNVDTEGKETGGHVVAVDAVGVGLIGRKHVERNEIDGNAARSFKP